LIKSKTKTQRGNGHNYSDRCAPLDMPHAAVPRQLHVVTRYRSGSCGPLRAPPVALPRLRIYVGTGYSRYLRYRSRRGACA
jgi:hypothetical protein